MRVLRGPVRTSWAWGLLMMSWPWAGVAEGQGYADGTRYMSSYRVSNYFIGPGWYGTSYGYASYGMPQTYSVFSAYPGPSYGGNLPPYGLMPGRYGVGLWRPGHVAPGYVYGASYYPSSAFAYRTFPLMLGAPSPRLGPPPSIGVYAPALGPVPGGLYEPGGLYDR